MNGSEHILSFSTSVPSLLSLNQSGIESIQPERNIPGIFAECSLSVSMFRTSREHLGNILKEKTIFDGKVVFMLKVFDLTITNVDLLANSSNHKAMFPEYSKNIPRIFISKILQGYPQNIVKL